MTRLESLPATEFVRAVQDEEGHVDLGEALAKFDEQGSLQITPLTRSREQQELARLRRRADPGAPADAT